MSISEQDLYTLMVLAQDHQKAAGEALKKLEDREVALNAVIARASTAVEEMNKAGHASALIIEKATRIAVEKAVQAALVTVQQQTQSALSDSVTPAVRALQGVTERAEQAEESLHQAASSISWKWAWGLGSNGTKNQHKPYHLRSEPSSQASASIKQLRISASWLISVSRSCTVLSSASSLR